VQKPARRGASTRARGGTLRAVLGYMPLVGKVLLAIIAGVLIFTGYRAAASASFFEARRVDIGGTSRASADDIKAVVSRAAARTGVWRADLQAISAEVEKLPWVRKAVVSRVLPDGLRVRVTERVPRAVVRTLVGRFIWVDEDAVSLGQMSPTDQIPDPDFFIRGWDESGSEPARAENRERVQRYLEMSREWGTLGLSERVSEVNLGDLRDVRAQLAGDDAHIEVRLGGENFGKRLKQALEVLDRDRDTPRGPFITYLDATPGKNIVVGHSLNARPENNETDGSPNDGATSTSNTDGRAEKPVKTNSNERTAKDKATRTEDEARRKKERDKKESSADGAKKEQTRPRRVG
jgi:cell division protein FtsQ